MDFEISIYNDYSAEFNMSISKKLSELESVYDEYYGISKEDRKIIQHELSVKNYYVYE